MHAIVILSTDHRLQAFITVHDGIIHAEYFDAQIEKELPPILDTLNQKTLSIFREIFDGNGGSSLIAIPVKSDGLEYAEAVAQELQAQRVRAALVDEDLKPYFMLVNEPHVELVERQQMLTALINLGPNDKSELLTTMAQIKPTLDQLKSNREEWKKFLQKKTDEILT